MDETGQENGGGVEEDVQRWLHGVNPELRAIMQHFEEAETWCQSVESGSLGAELQRLALAFSSDIFLKEADNDRLMQVLAHLHTTFCLHLMERAGAAHPPFNGTMLLHVQETILRRANLEPEARVLDARLKKIAGIHLLYKMFGAETRTRVMDILQNARQEEGL